MNQKYRHAEAFCLMTYMCDKCSYGEHVWNSRDGVTPFGFACARCPGTMFHVNPEDDLCKPDYIPEKGEHVWITLPPELRPVIARIRVRGCDGTEFETQGEEHERMVRDVAASFHEGEPFLIRWP